MLGFYVVNVAAIVVVKPATTGHLLQSDATGVIYPEFL